ncbi:glucosamine-6-phosphate deaminase [Acidomonas methanolica]|uniref:glucosamine-6-phosphate deaminase n=1 Tax=Acidomonas methanolica TaxID=437 RepID=UPI001C05D590|nr:glucosamine-6-phosphate deaminase [Acidomonas methanolica]MBU2655626.1 glucosamine-6-phosphate deaminase [Acidomonas methanolica]
MTSSSLSPRIGRLLILPDPDAATAAAARLIAQTIRNDARVVLGLATGRTMEGVYARLASMHRDEALSFSGVTTFNLDEYVGLSASDPNSYHHYMRTHLFDPVDADAARVHLPDGAAADPDAECAAYERAIRAVGGIALQLLGIGDTGHIGFNEPPSAFDTRTRVVELDEATRRQNAPMFGGDPEAVPREAITMGVGTILESKRLLLLATGPAKAAILAAALEGPVTPEVSASAIRLHPDVTVVLDTDAAAALSPAFKARATVAD